MDERVLQLRVGLVMLSALLIGGILVLLFGEGFQTTYDIFVKFQTAPGVAVGTPVRKNGIRIGRVSKVDAVDDGVVVTLSINSDAKIYDNEICRLGSASILGDAVFDIIQGMDPPSDFLLENEDQMVNTSNSVNLDQIFSDVGDIKQEVERTLKKIQEGMAQFQEASSQVSGLTQRVTQIVNAEQGNIQEFFANTKRLSAKAEIAVDNFGVAMASVNELIGDERLRKRLQETLDSLPGVFQEAEAALKEAKETVASFREISASATANLKNLEGITAPLGERGPQIIQKVETSIEDVNRLVLEITAFVKNVNESEGTVGMLLKDPRLYEELLQTLRNIESVTSTLKPIIRDVRVASDKIARDPFRFGVRGILDRKPTGSGVKGALINGSPQVFEADKNR